MTLNAQKQEVAIRFFVYLGLTAFCAACLYGCVKLVLAFS